MGAGYARKKEILFTNLIITMNGISYLYQIITS
jgi:hypothetical protein